jgi:hypothetical protein
MTLFAKDSRQGRETGGATARDRQRGVFDPLNAEAQQKGREKGGATARDSQRGLFDPIKAEAVLEGRRAGGRTSVYGQRNTYTPDKAEAVLEGRRAGGRKGNRAGKAKGGAAGKGGKKPRMSAAERELLPQGLCTGCGKTGVAGAQHNKPKSSWQGEKVEKSGRYQASE